MNYVDKINDTQNLKLTTLIAFPTTTTWIYSINRLNGLLFFTLTFSC